MRTAICYGCLVWLVYFSAPGPREIRDLVAGGTGVARHSSYLFTEHASEVCRRLRHVEGSVIVENLSSDTMHVVLVDWQMSRLLRYCVKKSLDMS